MVRLKHRFFICQADFGADAEAAAACTTAEIFSSIRISMLEILGDAGWGAAASMLAGPIRAAIALIKQIRKKSAALHVLQVAGSLRTLQLYLAQWQGALTGAMRASAAADSVVLDKEFLDALDADLADAMPGKRKSRDGDAPASSSHAGKSGPNANERASANESGKKRKR